jgi:hypothetical protein
MKGLPELDVRWRRFSISAKGREAIDAIRRPLFVLLLLNGALTAAVVIATIIQPDWWAVKDAVVVWIR